MTSTVNLKQPSRTRTNTYLFQRILENPVMLTPYYHTWALMRCPERAEVIPSILSSLTSLHLKVQCLISFLSIIHLHAENTRGRTSYKSLANTIYLFSTHVLPLSTVQPNTATTAGMEVSSVQWLEVRGAGISLINGIFTRSGNKAGCAWFEKRTENGVYEIFRYQTKKSCPQVA